MKRSAELDRWRTRYLQRKKNGRSGPPGSHARSRPALARHLRGSPQERPARFGSDRDGSAFGHASRRSCGAQPVAPIRRPTGRAADHPVPVRLPSRLSGITFQTGAHRRGRSHRHAPVLPVPALPSRTVPRRCRTGYHKHRVLSWSAPYAVTGHDLFPRSEPLFSH